MTLYLLLIGFASLFGQVVLLRELTVAFYGVELIYLLSLGFWMAFTALGAALGGRTSVPSVRTLAFLAVIFALLLPAEVVFIRALRILFHTLPGAYLPFGQQLFSVAVSLCPIGLVLGLMFQGAAKRFIASGGSLARAYAIESAGAVAGGITAGALIAAGVQNFSGGLLCSLVCLAAMSVLIPMQSSQSKTPLALSVIMMILFTVVLFDSRDLDFKMTRWTHPDLISSLDTPYGRATIADLEGRIAVFDNDAISFETQSPAAEEFVHLSAFQSRSIHRVLVLGGGASGIVHELCKYAPEEIIAVEIDQRSFQTIIHHLPANLKAPFLNNNVNAVFTDPRRFIMDKRREKPFDVILIGMPPPHSGQANRYYTSEFFRECRRSLSSSGLLALRFPTAENYWTPAQTGLIAGVNAALKTAFDNVLILPSATTILIASPAPLVKEPETAASLFRAAGIQSDLVTPQYVAYRYGNDRVASSSVLLDSSSVLPNRDLNPGCYRNALQIWMSRFVSGMLSWDPSQCLTGKSWMLPAIFLMAVFILAFLRRMEWIRLNLMALFAGMLGMICEGGLLLYYQSRYGILYQDIGMLLTLFMAGLTAGAMVVHRIVLRRGIRRRQGASLVLGLALLFLLLSQAVNLEGAPARLIAGVGLGAAGFLTSGIFSYASLLHPDRCMREVSPLYASDLIGGCIGVWGASLALIPFLGISHMLITGGLWGIILLILI